MQVYMAPRDDRTLTNSLADGFSSLLARLVDQAVRHIHVVPADYGVLDESSACLGHLQLLLSLQLPFGATEVQRPAHFIRALNLVEDLLDGLPQLDIVDIPQDENGFDYLPKGLESLVDGVLL